MPVAPAGRPDWLVEPTVDADSAHGASHRADHTSLQVLPGRSSADVDAGDVPAGRSAQSVSALRRFAGVDLDNPITLFKSFDRRSAGNGAGREDGVGMGTKVDGFMPQLNCGRKRPAERLASAMIFAAFVAVAALVGVICVTSLNAAFQDEKNTENLLHDARAFVPAQPGGTLPIDSFEGLQKPNMGHELSPHDSWAGHDFDVAFVTGDGGNSQEAKSSLGRMQQLTGVSRPAPAITAHVHGTRMSGLLHQKKSEGKETSADIQESLDKQADYIIGYPDLSDHSKGRTQDLVQRSHGNRIGMPALPALHPLRIQQEHHALRIGVYPKIAMKNVVTTEPVVMAVPHQTGFPNSISAPVKVMALPSSSEPSASVHVPFDWVKKYGLKTTHAANPKEKAEKRKQKFGEHVHHVTQAQQAAEAARQIIINGNPGKACFQEGHGAEPCPTIEYHPKEGEDWKGAPHRPKPKDNSSPAVSWIKDSEGHWVRAESSTAVPQTAPGQTSVDSGSGVPGENGEPGSPGQQGAAGQAGADGATGGPGENGEPGAAGQAGADGVPGENGQPGSPGQQGASGQAGADGATGVPGENGEPGAAVQAGADGIPGENGQPGSPGQQGTSGQASVDGVPMSDQNDGLTWPTPGTDEASSGSGNSTQGEESAPKTADQGSGRGRDDLSWPDQADSSGTPSAETTTSSDTSSDTSSPLLPPPPPPASTATATATSSPQPPPLAATDDHLTWTVGHLENIVGDLTGMVEKMLGEETKKANTVYYINNYNNISVQSANFSGPAVVAAHAQTVTVGNGKEHSDEESNEDSHSWSASVNAPAKEAYQPAVTPVLSEPDMWPFGGVYADQVVVHLGEDVNASSVYYSVNATGEQGSPMEYTAPFVLGPGWTKVEAVAVKSGYNVSAIKEAVFQVMDCNGDKCCNWRVVYLRFQSTLARLLARKEQIPKEQAARQADEDKSESNWLDAESKYQDARIKKKDAESGSQYARSFERKWGFAVSESQADLNDMEKRVIKQLRDLMDERELILDILAKLESDELSASTAMGMVQQSLAECSACKAWRSIAQSTLGDGAASTFALASTLGGREEVENVKAILQEILDDLNARKELYEKMLSNAKLQVVDNKQKFMKWAKEAAQMTAEVFTDKSRIAKYGDKSQELAGKLEAKKQALERGEKFMKDDLDIVDRHINAIQRILKRIADSLASCPGGAPQLALKGPSLSPALARIAPSTTAASSSTKAPVTTRLSVKELQRDLKVLGDGGQDKDDDALLINALQKDDSQ